MEIQNTNPNKQPAFELKEVEIRNSKYFNVFGIVMCVFMSLLMAWLYWVKFPDDVGNLIAFIFFVLGTLFFYWQLKDRSVKLRITKDGIWDYKELYSWADVEEVKTKTEVLSDVTHFNLVINFKNQSTIKKKQKFIDIMGYDRTTSEIDVFAKSYKKLFDERTNSNSQGLKNPETVPSGIDKHQKEMLYKTDEELLQIVNDRENHKVIDYQAARNELKKRSVNASE